MTTGKTIALTRWTFVDKVMHVLILPFTYRVGVQEVVIIVF